MPAAAATGGLVDSCGRILSRSGPLTLCLMGILYAHVLTVGVAINAHHTTSQVFPSRSCGMLTLHWRPSCAVSHTHLVGPAFLRAPTWLCTYPPVLRSAKRYLRPPLRQRQHESCPMFWSQHLGGELWQQSLDCMLHVCLIRQQLLQQPTTPGSAHAHAVPPSHHGCASWLQAMLKSPTSRAYVRMLSRMVQPLTAR
jgi:hypothetical protein